MTESRSPRVKAIDDDMSPSPSDSDGSELDAKSPRPTTPEENENLMEELHSALGEALMDQLENGDEDNGDIETQDSEKEQSLQNGENDADNDATSFRRAPVKSTDDGQVPLDASCQDDGQSRSSTEDPVDSTCLNPGSPSSTPTRGNAVSAASSPVTTQNDEVTTASSALGQDTIDDSLNNTSLTALEQGGDSFDLQKEVGNQLATDNVFSVDKMPPKAGQRSVSLPETMSDSSLVQEVVDGALPDSVALNDVEETHQEVSLLGDSELSALKGITGQTEEGNTESSPKANIGVQEESLPNYSIWGESASEPSNFSADSQCNPDDTNTNVLSPLMLPTAPLNVELAVSPGDNPLQTPASNPAEELEQADEIDKEMSLPSPSSRRLPVFASMAAEPPAVESADEEELRADEKQPESPLGADLLPRIGGSPLLQKQAVSVPTPTKTSYVVMQSGSPEAPQPVTQRTMDTTSPSVMQRALQQPAAEFMHLPGPPLEDGINRQGYVVVTNQPQVEQHFVPQMQKGQPVAFGAYPVPAFSTPMLSSTGGRHKIHLRLQEDGRLTGNKRSWFGRKARSYTRLGTIDAMESHMERGSITVSWFEGTSSTELQEHVRKSVIRKMCLKETAELTDLRIIDESIDPPEEIVLSTFIPDGSKFLLRFGLKDTDEMASAAAAPRHFRRHTSTDAPVSPSAAPSPYPSNADLGGLNASQLKLLQARLGKMPLVNEDENATAKRRAKREEPKKVVPESVALGDSEDAAPHSPIEMKLKRESKRDSDETDASSRGSAYSNGLDYPEDPIEARLRQITELLLLERGGMRGATGRREEKRQVIFVLANYFVLFLSLIAVSAEIQARAPSWMAWLESQMESVQQCANDRDALFECVSNGDFSGLIASFILWVTRSAATKRIFLFGFESPKRLWTVVYEALVTAFCWGTSYTFIRRGMNPDTRRNFLQKYWKDAVYGSLAGFNASFMKAVLKNLVPQEAFENALDDRELRLKIFSWLPSFHT